VRRAASRAIGQLVAVNRQRSSRRSLLGAPTVASARHTLSSRDDATSNCCVLNANGWQAFRVKLLHTTDSHSPPRSDNPNMRYLRGARKKTKGAPTSIRRHSRVIDLWRHAARTATAVERATAHVHSHVRGCRWVIWPCRPAQPTREPRRAPWPLQSSAGCRSNPPARGDPKFTLYVPSRDVTETALQNQDQN
jgi:hypothetical protein